MRNPSLPVAWLIASTVTLWSCTFGDEAHFTNQFIVDGKSYALAAAITTVHEETSAEGAAVHIWSVIVDSPLKARKAHRVSFDLCTNPTDVLPEGVYTFNAEQRKGAQTFNRVYVAVNYDRELQESGQVYHGFEGGTVTIRLLDEAARDYAISFDLFTDKGVVKGYYRGVIDIDR